MPACHIAAHLGLVTAPIERRCVWIGGRWAQAEPDCVREDLRASRHNLCFDSRPLPRINSNQARKRTGSPSPSSERVTAAKPIRN